MTLSSASNRSRSVSRVAYSGSILSKTAIPSYPIAARASATAAIRSEFIDYGCGL